MTAQDTIHLANDLRDQGKSNEAINLLTPLIRHKKIEISAQAYDAMGLCYQGQRQLDLALECYKKGLALVINSDLYERIENLHRNIGMIYEIREQWDEAEKYFLASIEYGQKHDEYQDQQRVSIGMTYARLGKMSVARNQLAKAKEYFDKSSDAFVGSKHYRWVTLNALYRVSYLIAIKSLHEAQSEITRIISELLEMKHIPWLLQAYRLAGDIEKGLGSIDKAKMYYLMTLHELRHLDSFEARQRVQAEIDQRLRPVLPSDEKDGVWQNEQLVRYEVI